MGWLVRNDPLPYGVTPDAYLRRTCEAYTAEATAKGHGCKILASAFVGSTWYAAAEITRGADGDKPARKFVTAFVFLTSGGSREFGYKDMGEESGPCEAACPKRILDMLTPVDQLPYQGYAADWRARCEAQRAKRAEQSRATRKLSVGMVLRFAKPIKFRGGAEACEFRIVPTPSRARGIILSQLDGGGLFRVPARLLVTAEIVGG